MPVSFLCWCRFRRTNDRLKIQLCARAPVKAGAGASPTAFLQILHLKARHNQGRGSRTRRDPGRGSRTRSGRRRPPAPSPPSAPLRWRWRPRPFLNTAPAVSGRQCCKGNKDSPAHTRAPAPPGGGEAQPERDGKGGRLRFPRAPTECQREMEQHV